MDPFTQVKNVHNMLGEDALQLDKRVFISLFPSLVRCVLLS